MNFIGIKVLSFLLAIIMLLSALVACETTTPPPQNETLPSTNQGTLPSTDQATSPYTEQATQQSTNQATLPSIGQATLPNIDQSTLPNIDQSTLPSIDQSMLPSIDQSTLPNIDQTLPSTYPSTGTQTNEPSDSYTDSDIGLNTDTVIDTEENTSSNIVTDTESSSNTENKTETATPDIEIDDSILTVFANGAYTAEFIRGELANQLDKNIYNEIRTLFKDKTKVNPALKTDFVGVGQELYNGPAILIGETSYQESKDVYKTLKDNQAIAKLVGNKYVIAFSNSDSAAKMVTTITSYLKKAAATEVKIDENWNATVKVTTSVSENSNFKDSGLTKQASLNNLGLGTKYDAGQGCSTYIKTDVASKSIYTNICTAIEKAGATRYTSNTIGTNLFSTYATQTQIIHVMYFPNKKEIRTAVDVRGTGTNGFSLPGLSTENKYTKKGNSSLTLCEIENSDWPGGLCMIFKLADGRFFVVDSGIGGRKDNGGSSCGWVYASLAKHADDPKNIRVAAWLITHVHSDHAGGLVDMARGWYQKNGSGTKHKVMPQECTQYIKIDKLIHNAPGKLPDSDRDGWMNEIINAFKIKNVVKAHPGQVFYLSDLTLTIYGSQDLIINQKVGDTNEQSVVSRAMFNGKSVLMLGDTFPKINKELATIYKEQLKSDVLQAAHHGYNNTAVTEVNRYCNPSIVLWPVSTGDMRRENILNVAVNAPLKGKTYYAPHGGNVVLDHNWKKSMISNSTILNMIPTCPCCGKRSSYSPKYDSKCPCGCQK